MAHEVNIHAAQTSILRELLFAPEAGFAQLQKPTGLTSNHFNFHIAKLVELGLVEQLRPGKYRLTSKGKEYANRLDTDERTIERQAKLAVLIVPRRERADGTVEYCVQRRLKQPFWGYYGFMSGKLRWGETVQQGGARELMEEMGLHGHLEVKAMYHKMDYTVDGRLLEDKHFYRMLATGLEGKFKAKFEGGENFWYTRDQIAALDKQFPGVDAVIREIERPGMQFFERKYTFREDQY
jgi:ADP-ribose pyrophosphatase YjhB (NUDIX family)